jgi:hypothetical protein
MWPFQLDEFDWAHHFQAGINRAGRIGTGLASRVGHVQSQTWPSPPTETGPVLEASRHRYTSPTPPQFHAVFPHPVVEKPVEKNPDAWGRRIRSLGLDSPEGSDTWQVAMVLMAAADIGQNIDRLARRTGSARPLVSKVARRLVENGVWASGETVARWVSDPAAGSAFANDVAVGQGRLLRRISESGRMEWAEAGKWHKGFERETDELGPSAVYTDAAPRQVVTTALSEEFEAAVPRRGRNGAEASEPAATVNPKAPVVPVPVLEPIPALDIVGATEPLAQDREPEPRRTPAPADSTGANGTDSDVSEAPSLDQVFSDAVWLR